MSKINALKIENMSVIINGIRILDNINLELDEKEFLGVIGPNGAGKTTLLKTLVGLVNPVQGSVRIYGKKLKEARSDIGYVPQFNTFDKSFPINVKEVVQIGLLGKNRSGKKTGETDLINKALSRVGLNHLSDRNIGELSGGELQRVLISRALVNNPKILLLDEPTASIDTYHGQSFYDLLKELNENITIILVSHDIGAVSSYVKKIACLNRKLVFHDSKEITKEMLESVYKCPVDLIAHGVPHRVFDNHNH